jgi:curved DNA-binding protein CbpA
MKKTLYEILGVKEQASADEIKEAYIRRVAAYQAAATMHDEAKFLKDAYDILSDPNKRKTYDASLGMGAQMPQIVYVEEKSGVSPKVIVLVGALVLLGGWYYVRSSEEQERLKIERATQLIQAQQALEKQRQEQQAAVQERQLDMSQQNQQRWADERKVQQDKYYLDQVQRQQEAAERRQKYEEQQRKLQEQREADMRARQAQAENQRQKLWLEQQERERYGYGYRRY